MSADCALACPKVNHGSYFMEEAAFSRNIRLKLRPFYCFIQLVVVVHKHC
jgi:hypothetical protein